jgi:hypothetical protein
MWKKSFLFAVVILFTLAVSVSHCRLAKKDLDQASSSSSDNDDEFSEFDNIEDEPPKKKQQQQQQYHEPVHHKQKVKKLFLPKKISICSLFKLV